jgi:hypothetical protein
MALSSVVVSCGRDQSGPKSGRNVSRLVGRLGSVLVGALLVSAVLAPTAFSAPTITTKAGVANPPPNVQSTGLNPQQTAIADKAVLVPVADFSAILQSTLIAQGFTAANNWTLVNNVATLDDNATFNITAYNISLNPGGTAFGETMDFTLNPNLAQPGNLPAGSTATLHWLQILNDDQRYGNFGYAIAGQQGFWQLDNGDVVGGAAAGAGTGPYYDSNAPGGGFSTPPGFHDFPRYYAGVGSYLHFLAIPTWDVFIPAGGGNPATESIMVGNYGIAWGFKIVPEPSSITLIAFGVVAIVGVAWKRRK